MAEKPHREKVSTRIDSTTVAVIEQLAEERRTTLAHVLRVLIEDGAQELAREAARAEQSGQAA